MDIVLLFLIQDHGLAAECAWAGWYGGQYWDVV